MPPGTGTLEAVGMNRFVRRSRAPRQIALGITLALGLASFASLPEGRAGARETFRFSWSAPEGCPSQGQVASEIVRLVGGDISLLARSDLQADVNVAGGQAWSASLTTEHAGLKGYRTVEAPSCQAAADAIALIIALAIDPDAVAAAPAAPTTAPEEPRRERRPLTIVASAHTQGRTGTLPRADVGVGVGVGLAGTRWRTMLRGTYGLRRDQTATLPSGASGRFNITTASLTGCIDLALLKLALGPCAVAEVGRASATGYGATAGFSRDVTWLAMGAGVFSSLAVSKHLRASLEVDALAPLYRPDFVFEDLPGVVFRAPTLGGRALLDVAWEF